MRVMVARKPPLRSTTERNALVVQFRFLPHRVAQRTFLGVVMDFDEAVSIGTLALINAAAKWDAHRGITFMTYAYCSVRNVIWNEIERRRTRSVPTVSMPLRDAERHSMDLVEAERRDEGPEPDILKRLREVLAKLPRHQREAIEGRYLRGELLKDLGPKLGITKQAAAYRCEGGLKRMRAMMEGAYA